MSYRIVQRGEYGLPNIVRGSTGALRPALTGANYITAHYTGNSISYAGKDVANEVRRIQNMFASTKPFEYNYVIGLPDDNNIYEYAGKFVAAHSSGENSVAYGVLFLVGVNDHVTPKMIDKWKWLRDTLKDSGNLRSNVDQRMHYQMPGAATSCPGDSIKSQWGSFIGPWRESAAPTPEPQPPQPLPPSEVIAVAERLEFMTPERWDTRGFGNPIPAGQYDVKFSGAEGKLGVKVNVLVTSPTSPGYATAWKGDSPAPNVSCLNYSQGQAVCNQIDVPLAGNGTFKVYISTPAHITCDLVGYWT